MRRRERVCVWWLPVSVPLLAWSLGIGGRSPSITPMAGFAAAARSDCPKSGSRGGGERDRCVPEFLRHALRAGEPVVGSRCSPGAGSGSGVRCVVGGERPPCLHGDWESAATHHDWWRQVWLRPCRAGQHRGDGGEVDCPRFTNPSPGRDGRAQTLDVEPVPVGARSQPSFLPGVPGSGFARFAVLTQRAIQRGARCNAPSTPCPRVIPSLFHSLCG